jgi:glutamine---fructose-6-phosphate transaminase (isomerizing)
LPIAYEASLKIKEISYINASGFSAMGLKHGTYALIEDKTPIIMIILDNDDKSQLNATIEEVKSRGANVITITDVYDDAYDHSDISLTIPHNKTFGFLLSAVPFQLIAYQLAIKRGNNPDRPRHLAKVVTVI